jgi:hypothetical protein
MPVVSMLLSFMRDPEGQQHYGKQIQGRGLDNGLPIKQILLSRSSILGIIQHLASEK